MKLQPTNWKRVVSQVLEAPFATGTRHLPSSIPIIGCDGISSGADALEFARAGASLVQVYTGFGHVAAWAYVGVSRMRRWTRPDFELEGIGAWTTQPRRARGGNNGKTD